MSHHDSRPDDPDPANAPVAGPRRRQFLVGTLAAAGLSIPMLAGCGGAGEQSSGSFPPVDTALLAAMAAAIKAGRPPVGGAEFFPDAHVILTQPTQGSYVALSSTCTHEGITIDRMRNGGLVCPAHGSRFDPATGQPTSGPAMAGLPKRTVSRTGATVTLS